MTDIELVIKISNYDKEWITNGYYIPEEINTRIAETIANGTPLPKGHGDLIDKEKLKANINGWYAFMKDICKQPYMTLKQEEIIGKIDIMTPIIEAESEEEE